MTAFRDLMRTRITCTDEGTYPRRGNHGCSDWCVRLDGHLLSSYTTRGIAIDDALQGRNSLTGLKQLVLYRCRELGGQVADALIEDRLEEAVQLSDERAQLLSCFLLIRQAWAERLAQNEELAPNVRAALREIQGEPYAAF